MNLHKVFIHIDQSCFAGTGAIVRLPQCQWSKPDGYGKISQCITTTKHSKAKTVCIFLGIFCTRENLVLKLKKHSCFSTPCLYQPRNRSANCKDMSIPVLNAKSSDQQLLLPKLMPLCIHYTWRYKLFAPFGVETKIWRQNIATIVCSWRVWKFSNFAWQFSSAKCGHTFYISIALR